MADPTKITLTADTWVKVATNITSGTIHLVNGLNIYHTYRDTGGAAPTNINDEGPVLAFPHNQTAELIESPSGIDIYMYSKDVDGIVRVDI